MKTHFEGVQMSAPNHRTLSKAELETVMDEITSHYSRTKRLVLEVLNGKSADRAYFSKLIEESYGLECEVKKLTEHALGSAHQLDKAFLTGGDSESIN